MVIFIINRLEQYCITKNVSIGESLYTYKYIKWIFQKIQSNNVNKFWTFIIKMINTKWVVEYFNFITIWSLMKIKNVVHPISSSFHFIISNLVLSIYRQELLSIPRFIYITISPTFLFRGKEIIILKLVRKSLLEHLKVI